MTMIQLAIVTVTVIAFARVAWVTAGLVRTWLRGGALVAARWGWIEALNIPEPLVLAGVTYTLAVQGLPPGPSSAPATAAAIFGAALARGGLGLSLWAFLSLPSVGGGHYVLCRGLPDLARRRARLWQRPRPRRLRGLCRADLPAVHPRGGTPDDRALR